MSLRSKNLTCELPPRRISSTWFLLSWICTIYGNVCFWHLADIAISAWRVNSAFWILVTGRLPFPPMRWAHVEPLRSSRLYPTANDSMTRKQKGMGFASVDDGQFKVAAERGCIYRLPHSLISQPSSTCFNSGHLRRSQEENTQRCPSMSAFRAKSDVQSLGSRSRLVKKVLSKSLQLQPFSLNHSQYLSLI
jgi:hypothetical protein